jgi:hypothetical protein
MLIILLSSKIFNHQLVADCLSIQPWVEQLAEIEPSLQITSPDSRSLLRTPPCHRQQPSMFLRSITA